MIDGPGLMLPGAEGAQAMLRKAAELVPKRIVQAEIADTEDAVFWRDGMGLYATVVAVGSPYDGQEGTFPVGGDLFYAFNGALHLRTLRRKQPVTVHLLEESMEGHGVIVSRVTTDKSNPVVSAGFRKLAGNFDRHNFDVFGDGEDVHTETVNGSIWYRINKSGSFVVNTPDGGSFVYDDASKSWKVKSGGGASLTVGPAGVCLRSPDGASFLEVSNAGVTSNTGGTNRVSGAVIAIGVEPGAAPAPALKGTPLTPIVSTKVLIG